LPGPILGGLLPCFLGWYRQSRNSGAVINIIIGIPTDRSRFVRQRGIEQRTERDHVLGCAADVVIGDETPVDPDPVASFRQLIALPPDTTREAPRIDPRRMRTIVDRGVVGRKPMENGQEARA
jgi:hypothetical protein